MVGELQPDVAANGVLRCHKLRVRQLCLGQDVGLEYVAQLETFEEQGFGLCFYKKINPSGFVLFTRQFFFSDRIIGHGNALYLDNGVDC